MVAAGEAEEIGGRRTPRLPAKRGSCHILQYNAVNDKEERYPCKTENSDGSGAVCGYCEFGTDI